MTGETIPELVAAYDGVALVLQGGGALGAYQAGVFEGLAEAGIEPGWLAGVSIGAINAAIIAGNPPERRCEALRDFWRTISSPGFFGPIGRTIAEFVGDGEGRAALSQWSAGVTLLTGQPGFFSPRLVPPFFAPPGTVCGDRFGAFHTIRAPSCPRQCIADVDYVDRSRTTH